MNRLTRQEYINIEKIIKRFKSNYKSIKDITDDIVSLESPFMNGIKSYFISDTVLAKVIKLDSNTELKIATIEYRAVLRALELISKDAQNIFIELYILNKNKWDIEYELCLSDRTFERKKQELIYTVYKQLKKFQKNGG